jgi:hypothetical protein
MNYVNWNVRGMAHKEEDLCNVLDEKQFKISTISELKKLEVTLKKIITH